MSRISPTDEQQAAIGNIETSLPLTAGAGSGKTFVLTHRYFQILAERKADLSRILTITFTDKAATQMKRKIRALLTEFARGAKPDEFPPVQKDDLQFPEPSEWQEMLDNFQQAYISTFHGFCTRMLREVATDVGLDPDFAVMDEHITALRRPEIIRQTIFDLIENRDENIALWLRYFSVFQILERFENMVMNRSRYEELEQCYLGDKESPRSVNELLTAIREQYVAQIKPVMADLGDHPVWREFLQMLSLMQPLDQSDRFYANYIALRKVVAEIQNASSPEQELNHWINLPQYLVKNRGSKKNWENVDFTEFKNLMGTLRDDVISPALEGLTPFSEANEQQAILLSQAGARIYRTVLNRFQEWKQQYNYFDYDDLLIEAVRILREYPEIRRQHNRKFRHILVDEFQDTNPIQYELVNLLRENPEGNDSGILFVVGDPKQSIYRFRGTEVRLFREAQRTLAGEDHPLQQSFRSQPELLKWYNACFSRVMGTSEDGDSVFTDYEQYFLPLSPTRSSVQPNQSPITVQIIETKSESDQDTVENRIQVEAAHIANWLGNKLGQIMVESEQGGMRPAKFGDVAVLFRKTTHLKQYEYALQLAGIPFYTVSGKGLYSTQEVRDLFNVLQALAFPEDEISLVGVLRSALFGVSDEALFWLARDVLSWRRKIFDPDYTPPKVLNSENQKAFEQARQCLRRWSAIRDQAPVSWLAEMICTETGYFGVIGSGEHGTQRVRNVEQFLQFTTEFSRNLDASLRSFVQYVQRLQEETEAEEAGIYSEAHDAVQLMTIHKSKGLEFPVVVLPNLGISGNHGLQKDFYPEIGWALKWRDPERAADEQEVEPLAYHQVKDTERRQELAESKRLFYVASTRARDHLLLSGIIDGKDAMNKTLSKDADSRDDWMLWTLDTLQSLGWSPGEDQPEELPESIKILHRQYIDVPALPAAEEIISSSNTNSQENSTGELPDILDLETIQHRWEYRAPQYGLQEITPTMISDFVRDREKFYQHHVLGKPEIENRFQSSNRVSGAEFGSLAHSVIERWLEMDDSEPDRIIGDYILHSIYRESEEARELLNEFVATLKHSELNEIVRGCSVRTEVSFLAKIAGVPLTGSIDLLAENGDGTYRIFDLKSDRINDSAGTIAEKVTRYRYQLLAYAYALHQSRGRLPERLALYFLRNGALREIEIDDSALASLEKNAESMITFVAEHPADV